MEESRKEYLVKGYIEGTATTSEREELLSWYRAEGNEARLSPYQSESEENEAKKRIFNNIQQQVKATGPSKSLTLSRLAIAASVIVIVCLAIFWSTNKGNSAVELATVTTKAGERKIIELTDGSKIWLSAKSSLIYPVAFNGRTREVTFTGEAFFDIAKDKKHPFIVHTANTSTRVLGTSFNIRSFTEHEDVVIALFTGKVSFAGDKKDVTLLPNNQIVYNKKTNLTKVLPIPDVSAILGRHNGYYEYKNVPAKEVVEDITRLYNLQVKVQGGVKDCTFFGRIKPGESPEKFLKKMAFVVNAKMTQKDSVWTIKGGGCNLK
ncbi:FecR family protein [Mucilaginibacter terrenus]|uniref:FecR family protein n=1 Tax=Mucilaginibacter terrenus TaxID=2482727 RepID=A0A3E2NT03_9SPHI|nr:FecR family protein [Mucilaginibacter terrenus]RFZ84155.1 FecR family protein [Mucilaginibacter terrenus]